MNKYSNDFKIQVIKYCIEEHHGYKEAAKHFNIPSTTPIMRWIRKYKKNGIEGISYKTNRYDGNFKQNVIEYMHENHLSLEEACIKFNIANPSSISKWEHIYYKEGPLALYAERRGRKKNMSSKPRKKKISKEVDEDLIAEVERLRMENAYLKKLQALVQERTKPKNGKK